MSTALVEARRPFYILHPICDEDGQLRVWIEAAGGAPAPPPLYGMPTRVPFHPRALVREYAAFLTVTETRAVAHRAPTQPPAVPIGTLPPLGDTVVYLPTTGTRPLPSPTAGGPKKPRKPLKPWTVNIWACNAPRTPGLLHPCVPVEGHLRLGPAWTAWWHMTAWIDGLLDRGAVVPGLQEGRQGLRAVWRPVLAGADQQMAVALAAAVPPVCLPQGLRDPGIPPWMRAFVEWYGDAEVRRRIGRHPALSPWRQADPQETRTAVRWLAALLDPGDGRMPLRGRQFSQLRPWLRDPLSLEGPARLALQLVEPEGAAEGDDPADSWQLYVYVVPPAEPGVLIPAENIWTSDGPDAPHARALAEALEAAGAVFPPLAAAAANHQNPVPLTTEAAWTLLAEAGPDLRAQGVSLRLPAWWQAPPARARLRLGTASPSGLLGRDGLVQFSWEVAVGGHTLSAAEFDALVARRRPLVRLQDGWVAVPPQTARALAARWRTAREGQVGVGNAVLMALAAGAELPDADAPDQDPPPTVDVVTDAAMEQLLAGLASPPAPTPAPPGFAGVLRPYQQVGVGWLAQRADLGLGGILADDMGLGKTVQVLAAIAHRKAQGQGGPVLVVAPTSVVANWGLEAARFTPALRTRIHQGANRARGQDVLDQAAGADLVITSYALLLRDADTLHRVTWDGVVLDEAQNVKNTLTRQGQAARGLAARWRLALTGTPIENSLTDLWSILAFAQPGYLGGLTAFRRRLALPAERGEPAALATLRRLITPFVLRRSKREPGIADELPDKIETRQDCALTPEQAALYAAAIAELMARVADSRGMQRRAAILLTLLRLKQICNHPAQYTGDQGPLEGRSGKWERLEDLLAEVVAEGEAALVFTQFPSFGRRLVSHLRARWPDIPVLFLEGATPADQRARMVERFQILESGGAGIFVLSLKAGGAGLNLTAAQHVFHLDLWWNPAVERQATDRAHRIGQRRAVQVHRLICVGTLEERIDRLLRSKEALAEGVLGSGEGWLTELSDTELHDLVALRRTALGVQGGHGRSKPARRSNGRGDDQ